MMGLWCIGENLGTIVDWSSRLAKVKVGERFLRTTRGSCPLRSRRNRHQTINREKFELTSQPRHESCHENKRCDSFSATNQVKARLLKLNIPTPCPPRSAVLVIARAWFHEPVSSQHAQFAFSQVRLPIAMRMTQMKTHSRKLLWLLFLTAAFVAPAQAFQDPSLGRWLNRDPLGEPGFEILRGGQADLPGDGLNLYSFVQNDPIDRTDYLGLYGSSIDNAVRTCMALPTPAQRAKCMQDLIDTLGGGKSSKCCVLAAAVQVAKKGAKALGSCSSGDSCAVLKAKQAAWIALAAARSSLHKHCFAGGDPGHQQQLADHWKTVGDCIKHQINNGCKGPL
jgi:RHS repeat-associated protein